MSDKHKDLESYEKISRYLSDADYKIYEESLKALEVSIDNVISKLEEYIDSPEKAVEFAKNINESIAKTIGMPDA